MKKIYCKFFALFSFLLIYNFTFNIHNCMCQWVQLTTPQNAAYTSIYFTDANNGFIAGGNAIKLKTTNGGTNWTIISYSPIPQAGYCFDVKFVNALTGFSAESQGAIGKTTNGGYNWEFMLTGISENIACLDFVNETTGYSGAWHGKICKTTNGGLNWASYTAIQGTDDITSIDFINAQTGYAATDFQHIIKTTNGGVNWDIVPCTLGVNYLSMRFLNESTGYLAGYSTTPNVGKIIKTTNGGTSWQDLQYGSGIILRRVFFNDVNTGYVCGDSGRIYRTSNGGLNWSLQQSPVNGVIANMCFPTSAIGYAIGSGYSEGISIILKTTNGGSVSVQNISTEVPSAYSLGQNYPNPFNPISNIKYKISKSGDVIITVFDVTGKEVEVLVDEKQSPGEYLVTFDGSMLPSGVYFYKITVHHGGSPTDGFSETKRMLMIK